MRQPQGTGTVSSVCQRAATLRIGVEQATTKQQWRLTPAVERPLNYVAPLHGSVPPFFSHRPLRAWRSRTHSNRAGTTPTLKVLWHTHHGASQRELLATHPQLTWADRTAGTHHTRGGLFYSMIPARLWLLVPRVERNTPLGREGRASRKEDLHPVEGASQFWWILPILAQHKKKEDCAGRRISQLGRT